MRRLIVSEWMALDGVFDAGTMDEWFHPYQSVDRAAYIQEGVLGSDLFLFGRVTYEMLAPFWSQAKNNEMGIGDAMNSIAKYVFSSKPLTIPWHNTRRLQGDFIEAITRLKQESGREIRLAGSATLVRSLGAAGLVDEYRFLVHPVIMKRGKNFFKEGIESSRLELVNTRMFSKGVMLLSYQPDKHNSPVDIE